MNAYCCNNNERRLAVLQHPTVNGIDFIEVIDNPADSDKIRQTVLAIYFLKDVLPNGLTPDNIQINGGIRIKNIKAVTVTRADLISPPPPSPIAPEANVVIVKLNKAGDFSTYQFRLVNEDGDDNPPDGFDPLLSSIDFSFKVACPNEFDCKSELDCDDRKIIPSPEINYLAKDYASIKQLMLDRMAITIPDWKERNAADIGIMLVELLSYTADYLNYRQDAIATEAYLGTARQRISVKRHARLVDYKMHDGCNARAWIHVEVKDGISGITLKGNQNGNSIKLVTASPGKSPVLKLNSSEADELFRQRNCKVFEPMHDLALDAKLNKLFFYTWGISKCQLKQGATTATIDGHFSELEGKYLLIQEEVNPHTFKSADADPKRKHVVKIVSATLSHDLLGEANSSPADPLGRQVTEIVWDKKDALPFSFCLNTIGNEGEAINVSTLLGNILLADHGNTMEEELIYNQAAKTLLLHNGPVSNNYVDLDNSSASEVKYTDLQKAMPFIQLKELDATDSVWNPAADLISSVFNSKLFVVDVDNEGKALLRFGNNINGQQPADGTRFNATYRVGNGLNGNLPSGAIAHIVSDDANISSDTIAWVTNPIASFGGKDPESISEVRYKAPVAFRRQERAVTTEDYEEKSKASNSNIQRTSASLRWTGSWRTVFLSVDTLDEQVMNKKFVTDLSNSLEKYRMAGQDLEIENPKFVALEIEIDVCVQQNYYRSDVKRELITFLSNRVLSDGTKGLFHPDNFTFGQTVYLSNIYSAIQKQEGVLSVTIKKFQRLGLNNSSALESGKLLMGRNEIARLDNDPSAFEKGILTLNMSGGN